MTDTRDRLLAGTLDVLRDRGITGVSARTVAAAAEVNQALVFYHFGSVDQLIDAACRADAETAVAAARERLAAITSLTGLVELARNLYGEQDARGDVTVMAQVLAGARHDPRLAPAARHALGLWVAELEPVLARLLGVTPLAGAVDVPALTRAVAAAFVGVELYAGVEPQLSDAALGALAQLAAVVEVVGDLPTPVRTTIGRALRRRIRSTATTG